MRPVKNKLTSSLLILTFFGTTLSPVFTHHALAATTKTVQAETTSKVSTNSNSKVTAKTTIKNTTTKTATNTTKKTTDPKKTTPPAKTPSKSTPPKTTPPKTTPPKDTKGKPVSRGSEGVEAIKDVDKLIGTALSLKGTPYVYGGSTPKGFDCSGFTSYCYKAIGIDIPHSSLDQSKQGTQLTKEQLIPGAIVYFNTTGKGVSHVGIYLGNGEFVHASSGGKQVMVSNLNEGYYKERYLGATVIK